MTLKCPSINMHEVREGSHIGVIPALDKVPEGHQNSRLPLLETTSKPSKSAEVVYVVEYLDTLPATSNHI